MTWLNDSIMRRRGLAQGRTPTLHHLTEAMQGKFHYTIGPYSDPVLHVQPGDRITGVHRPGAGARFYFNGRLRASVDDAAFARAFFGIWLSPSTSEPRLRSALLSGSAP